jgi:uncharacterized membrane protein YgdD (TMEM256/DUF423 family)
VHKFFIAYAGLMGAAGVLLAAQAAHGSSGSGLDSAAHMLLVHALAVLAGSALLEQKRLCRPGALAALAAWTAGGTLFASDIATRAFVGQRLFPMAAPIGGTLLIAGWVALTGAALLAANRPSQ